MKTILTKNTFTFLRYLTLLGVELMRPHFLVATLLLLSSCGSDSDSGGGGGDSSGASSSTKPKACTTDNGSGQKVWNKTTKKHSETCTITACDAGYDNVVDKTECQPTAATYYSPTNNNARIACSTPNNSSPTTTTGRSSADACFTCAGGYDNTQDPTKCQQTAANFYSPANNNARTACPTPSNSSPATTTELSSADGCYTCDGGYLKNTGENTCGVPSKGKHVNASGTEVSCSPITLQRGATATWIAGAAATADACPFSCSTGFVKSGRACNIPRKGHYADNGVEKSCSPITEDTGGFDDFVANTGAVSAADGCGFSCSTGFVKSGRSCNFPSTGNYVNTGNTEASCDSNPITTEGTATATWIAGAAATAATCPFSCSAGYLKDSSARECKYPTLGNYVNASGTEVGCTNITGMTGFGSWLDGAATDADSCPFSCASGYTISGRTCNKARPQTLALGRSSSHVLFDNGEVEAWGSVSTSPFKTHIKENLGNNTPQALESGYNHQCIILKNGSLNHGRLMCWGQNGGEQLGVGDTNPRSTPTDVSVAVLGDTGDGATPKTVKSVAAGDEHTCALLNDDTVKCWGQNSNGQIGGGSGAKNTISGTVGGPLGSTTANRISAGRWHTCAVLTDSTVQCWGTNAWGQTSGGTPNLGVNKTATEIAVGDISSCAILNDASVKCWGNKRIPSPSLGVNKTATRVTVGGNHACALLTDKTVYCWGRNPVGQLGSGVDASSRVLRGTTEGDPLGGQTAIEIATGYEHNCAIMESDHSVKCWGSNIDENDSGFYGQIVGEVAMAGGTDGTGTSTGESQVLTAVATPTATALDSDEDGQICKIELSGGTLSGTLGSWVAKEYTTPLTYNGGGSTAITDAIDNLIAAIGSTVNVAGTINVTLAKKDNDKIEATVNNAILDGMTLTIYHDDNGGDCTTGTVVTTAIPLTGGSGAAEAEGLWVISNDFSGSGDKTVNLDSVHIDLGTSSLTKEGIASKIVSEVSDVNWAGKQYVDLPYTTTILDGSSDAGDDCPANDFCVAFWRVFKGTEGNYGIPFGDRDYSH